ncbi:MAG TPA: hypothetical protein VL172_18840 [Kofleriaceae bacterium]|nr:hypothetical protein [Kofleriaceae bacterium]
MTRVRTAALLALALACQRSDVPHDPPPARGDAGPPQPPPGPKKMQVPANRACGEAGPIVTPLPPALFDGMSADGDGTVSPKQKVRVGGVEVNYLTDAWIGNMETGHRGEALDLTIDRAEAGEHMPWGAQIEARPKLTYRSFIGPYRIDLTATAEDPPQKVAIHVDKRACPDHAIVPPPSGPIWMWLSTEAIRLFTVDMDNQMLQVMIDARDNGPRAEIRTLGWSQSLSPVPGRMFTARIDGRSVTIEATEPARGTRYDASGWHATQGTPRANMRVRVDPAPPLPMPAMSLASAPCGDATTARSAPPPELSATPHVVGEVALGAGDKRMLDGIELQGYAEEIPASPGYGGRKAEKLLIISSAGMTSSSVTFGGSAYPPEPTRAERAMFLFEAADSGSPPARVRARAYRLPCPRTLALPVPGAPQFVWLSTIGHGYVTFGPPDRPVLRLQADAGARDPSLSIDAGDDARDGRNIEPALVGHVATFNGLRILVTDVFLPATKAPFPVAHVQVRIDRP